ncbi:MAG: hypothetical protein IJY17_08285 [Alphaproteobacteria bacterium]|nr:hypothetical protein [Alphaproteobacteria bacterium]
MNVFFKIMLFLFVFAGAAGTSRAQTPAGDPNAPAPESPIQVRLPHSPRTKDNVLDSVLDFAFVQFFKLFKDVEISYDFFEVDIDGNLNFTNFKVKTSRPSVQGIATISKININLKEFLTFIKGKQLVISKVVLTGISADMTLIEKKDEKEKKRSLMYSAKQMTLNNVILDEFGNRQEKKKNKAYNVSAKTVSAEKASLGLSNPREKYAASSAEIKDFVLSEEGIDRISFSSAETGGKVYTDRAAFLRAIRQ